MTIGVLLLDNIDRIGIIQSSLVKCAVNIIDQENLLVGEISAAQTYDVDSAINERIPSHQYIRRDVLREAGATLDHHMLRDAYELVYQHSAADDGMVVYFYFAGYL